MRRKGILTLLASVLVIASVMFSLGLGTMAYFSDTETSDNNIFTAGTLDVTLTGGSFTFTNQKPGDIRSGTMTVKNDGTLNGYLYGRTSYVQADANPNPAPDVDADAFAKMLIITSFKVDGYEMITAGSEPTMFDWATSKGPWILGQQWDSYGALGFGVSRTLDLTVQFDPLAGNDYQGDGISLKVEFLLYQNLVT